MTGPTLVCVAGPTASGKSDLALRVAETLGGEIVNCDSLQIYRGMNIGTAKTPADERRGVPHHLVDIVEPDRVFTAGEYARVARAVLAEIAGRGRVPVVAGGTGFYLKALLDGLFEGPAANPGLRERLARRPERLHRMLARFDAAAAARIHPNDIKKQIRALEVCIEQRRPISELQPHRRPLEGFDVRKIVLEPRRPELWTRIGERTRAIYASGLVEETARVAARYGSGAKALEAIGYREALDHLEGRLPLAEAIALTEIHTRQYAKRQTTWFRREAGACRIAGFGNQNETYEAAIRFAREKK